MATKIDLTLTGVVIEVWIAAALEVAWAVEAMTTADLETWATMIGRSKDSSTVVAAVAT